MKLDIMPEDVMLYNEKGIVRKKGGRFQFPSPFARKNLLFVLWCDDYICIPPYQVEREGMEAMLLFRITKGELQFQYRGKHFAAHEGELVLLDCRRYQKYWAEKQVSFQFIHFTGQISQEYCEHLYSVHGAVFQDTQETILCVKEIFDELGKDIPSEYLLSKQLYVLLSSMAYESRAEVSPVIKEAQQFFQENLEEPVSVDDAAVKLSMSRGYLTRKFTSEVGFSPHEYLTRLRIRRACSLLGKTDKTIESIACECGFSSASNFIRTFSKEMDITPARFRKYYY